MKRDWTLARFVLLLVADVLLVNLTVYLSFLVVFGLGHVPARNFNAWLHVWWSISLLKVMVFQLAGLYDNPEEQTALGLGLLSAWGSFLASVGVMAVAFFSRDFAFPRSVVGVNFFLTALLVWMSRVVVLVWVRRSLGPLRLLCVGVPVLESWQDMQLESIREIPIAEATPEHIRASKLAGGRTALVAPRECPVVGGWLKAGLVDEPGLDILLAPQLSDCMMGLGAFRVLGDLPVMPLRAIPMNMRQRGMKRTMDLFFAVPALLVLGVLLVFLAPLMWLTQGWGLFYAQERVGLGGRTFGVVKLRTMKKNSEAGTGPVLAAGAQDPRVTALGYWLRLLKIDELPQFWNVLKGQMAVVGPRPERPFFVAQFEKEIPLYAERHRVRPGVTGLSQVHGRYHTTAEVKLKFDLWYAYNYSLSLDLRLVLDTVKMVLSRAAKKET